MKLRAVILLFLFITSKFYSQDTTDLNKSSLKNNYIEFNFSQNTASLLKPSFLAFHPGINSTLTCQLNNSDKFQIRQDFIAGLFYHKSFQSVIQLYSELNFKIKVLDRFYLSPLVMGGGYYMSFLNMQSFYWNGNQYISRAITMKNNWVISLGSNLEFPTKLKLINKPINIIAKYRLQVQGVIVRYNVPIIAYSPIMLGISLPINN